MTQKGQTDTIDSANTPRIYLASLADYNAGRVHGRWIDANQDAEAIHEVIAALLAESREPVAEEWAILDYENFAGLSLSEFEDIEQVAHAGHLIAKHGEVFAALLKHLGGVEDAELGKRYIEEGYWGEYDNLEDFAIELIKDCYGDTLKLLPDFIRHRIDYEGIAQDMELNGDFFVVEVGHMKHVFLNHI